MTIDLTEKEAETILQLVDLGLKAEGIKALGAANMVINKIGEAKKAEMQKLESGK